MKIQVALDVTGLGRALDIAGQVAGLADVIEAGTPLLSRHGLRAVEALRGAHPEAVIVADGKIMDNGELEAAQAIGAGASGIVVQGAAALATVRAACVTALALGGFAMVDCIGIRDAARLSRELGGVPFSYLVIHRGNDEQLLAGPVRELPCVPGRQLAIAGGITPATVRDVAGADLIIAGKAVIRSADPRQAVRDLRAAAGKEALA